MGYISTSVRQAAGQVLKSVQVQMQVGFEQDCADSPPFKQREQQEGQTRMAAGAGGASWLVPRVKDGV